MKKFILTILLSAIMLTTIHSASYAQLSVSINIGTQPTWGPVGYDHADYYYLPDVESYYSVQTHQFIYLSNGRWIYAASLPGRYSNYDLYSGYKVVVNRPRPYLNFSQDRIQYGKYKGYRSRQPIIRDSRDVKYTRYHGNPHGMPPGQAKKWDNHGNDHHDDREHGNGNHGNNGHDNGNHGGDKHNNGHGRSHDH